MTVPETPAEEWVTREQIDEVIDQMSAADLVHAMGDKDKMGGTALASAAFNAAAARLGKSNGTPMLEHVRMSDFSYFAEKAGAAINVENPTSEGQKV